MDRADSLSRRLSSCGDLESTLATILDWAIALHDAQLGNVQIYDNGVLTIAAQRGFKQEFLRTFAEVSAMDGCACGRAMREGRPVMIFDVETDKAYAPFRAAAAAAGFRAVQSTPLVSSDGEFIGLVSTHFTRPHVPSVEEMKALVDVGTLVADAIQAHRFARPPRSLRS